MRRAVVVSALALVAACGPRRPPADASVEQLREAAARSDDGETLGRLLLAELVSTGGEPAKAIDARKRLDGVAHDGVYGSLARAVDDRAHGRLGGAAAALVDLLRAARDSRDPIAPLAAWYASSELAELRGSVAGLWKTAKQPVEGMIARPGFLGWRARGELVDWWSAEAYEEATAGSADLAAEKHGCVRAARMAGPFGRGVSADRRTRFAPERPGPWPAVFDADPRRAARARTLAVERHGCMLQASEGTAPGVFYVETFFDLPDERDVLLAVQGAFAVDVDDHVVLDRDLRTWAIWPKFGVRLRLSRGRHRVVARIGTPETAIRLLGADGTPLGAPTSDDARAPYVTQAPGILADPNVADRFVEAGRPIDVGDDVARWLGAHVAHVDGQDDLASVIVEPLVKDPAHAAPLALEIAAKYVEKDPLFAEGDAHDVAKDLRARAVERDPKLWFSRYWLVLDEADKRGLPDAVADLRKVADEFRDAPQPLLGLASLYGRLGWRAERAAVLGEAIERFPDDRAALEQSLGVLEEAGKREKADAIAAHIHALDPDSEIELDRALARRDYAAARRELERLAKRRPDRKDVVERLADVAQRAGAAIDPFEKLERALAKNPRDAQARASLADARFATGDHGALRKALADALSRGAGTSELRAAIELVEGATELEPWRIDGRAVVKEFEASKTAMDGTAARVLDYSTIWVHPDGSHRMLEHELVRVQSQEAIGKLAEQRVPEGLVLRMRVLKPDGAVLEPEWVAGKPTLTLPHLAVGDYVETEYVTSQPGDGQGGKRYLGPHWFFREADVAYFRSELVLVTPKEAKLDLEVTGDVPSPAMREIGPLVERRWRVDKSPAAPEEPSSVPITEFLPSVRVGWGITLADSLERLAEQVSDELPRDPRIARIAAHVADDPSPTASPDERARRLYRWVVQNVTDGRETDGRRVVTGKSGNRMTAFAYLCRVAGLDVELAAVRDKLAPEPRSPMAEAESFGDYVLRLGTPSPVWLTVGDKFAPFGYLPAPLRGQPARRLVAGLPAATTPREGSLDGIAYEGKAKLAADGSASIDLTLRFLGSVGIGLRATVEQLTETELKAAIESKLLTRILPGAKLASLEVVDKTNLDAPLSMRVRADVSDFARRRGATLEIEPPFAIKVSQLATLPERQTPLLVREPTFTSVHLEIALPEGARVATDLAPVHVEHDGRVVDVKDAARPGVLVLDRRIDVSAGRVQPAAYPAFKRFAREADEATLRVLAIGLGGG